MKGFLLKESLLGHCQQKKKKETHLGAWSLNPQQHGQGKKHVPHQKFFKAFYTSSTGEKDVSGSERIYINCTQRGREKVKWAKGMAGHWSLQSSYVNKKWRLLGFWGSMALGCCLFLDNLRKQPPLTVPTYTKECEQSFVGFALQLLTS